MTFISFILFFIFLIKGSQNDIAIKEASVYAKVNEEEKSE